MLVVRVDESVRKSLVFDAAVIDNGEISVLLFVVPSFIDTPRESGVEAPLNHPPKPRFTRSSSRISLVLLPVNVGINTSSAFSFTGDCEFFEISIFSVVGDVEGQSFGSECLCDRECKGAGIGISPIYDGDGLAPRW